jgi:polyphosphate kinase
MSGKENPVFNREMSWLEFNQRVLDEARDSSNPLLERLNFLSITGSNLDEFFMVRVGGLQILEEQGVETCDASGMTPTQQLEAVSRRTHQMAREQYLCLGQELEPQLAQRGVRRLSGKDLSEAQRSALAQVFERRVFPVVSPMGIESVRHFPLVVNLALNLVVRLGATDQQPSSAEFAIIPLGSRTERFFEMPSSDGYTYILLEDLIGVFLDRFFPGRQVLEYAAFRITRNADMSVREDMAADLLAGMQEVLNARRKSDCVRLEIQEDVSRPLLAFLKKALKVTERDTCRAPGPLDLAAFRKLASLEGFPQLRYEPWPPQPSPDLDLRNSIFSELSNRNVLLYHPYDSFEPVVRFVQEAADDPDVLAIKQILYRTSKNSPIVEALRRAAENGKYVTAIVELKARFDEARNIAWARELEEAGVQVIYGVKGLKTHAKVCIVVRREPQGIVRYLHFGTGNYNEITARLYSDASYFTCDPDLADDASAFFNAVTGYSQPGRLLKLELAPIGLKARFVELIESEIERKRQGQKALIMAKMNSLADSKLIKALYKASKAGVRVQLNVRGICCLRPGVKGLSENISVVSIVDRFLEHSRIYYFHQGGAERVFISSADWMPRNLDRRVELLTPIDDQACRRRLISILETYFKDNVKSRRLMPDGSYEMIRPAAGRKPLRSQEALYQQACQLVKQLEQARRTVFEPYRPSSDKS